MTTTTANIAAWLEHRLDATLGFHLPAARLYGIVVNDPYSLARDEPGCTNTARSSFIGESRDVYSLIGGSCGVLARSFDAAAIVTGGWAAPMIDDASMSDRPSKHPERRRVRALAVVDDSGIASVLRFEDDPLQPVVMPEQMVGDLVIALSSMWFGADDEIVNLRTTRGGCRRRP